MSGRPARAAWVALAIALAFTASGCSLFRWSEGMRPEVTAPDSVAVEPAPAPPDPPPEQTAPRKTVKSPPATTAPPAAAVDSAAVVPERTPSITVRLSPEERSARETRYREDVDRAVKSLDLVRARALTRADLDELSAADQFLADARRAFEASDLTRACAVAEKARVLAEELRDRLAPP